MIYLLITNISLTKFLASINYSLGILFNSKRNIYFTTYSRTDELGVKRCLANP